MLRLSDFTHLPEVDHALQDLLTDSAGLTLVAGPDGQVSGASATDHFLPSGRQTIYRILVGELLDAHPHERCLVISSERDLLRAARRFKSRLTYEQIKPARTYDQLLTDAVTGPYGIVVVDRLTPETTAAALRLASSGKIVISQLDTVHYGAGVVRALMELGATESHLRSLHWILTVQRLPLLCPICRRPALISAEQLDRLGALSQRFPGLLESQAPANGGAFASAAGCPACAGTGRQGDVSVFDIYEAAGPVPAIFEQSSRLPLEGYIWLMAQRGQLALSDALDFERDQMRRVYNLVSASEQRSERTSRQLERKIMELENVNKVLEQRTRELVALEAIGQALLSSSDLANLGARVIRSAMDLCKADRAVLYYVRSADWAQVLAVNGWISATTGTGLARSLVFEHASDREQQPFLELPPGLDIPSDSAPPRSGLAIPLVADNKPGGLMIIQSTRKRNFAPGEVALLETLAGHAAVAMQRSSLIEQLQAKITDLEAAQVELAQKERLDRELELAREVQFSMIPQSFPDVPQLAFAAHYAPARQVGGDFYDAILLPDNRVGLVIADVSDKGMPAAMYMTLVRTLILAGAGQEESPRNMLNNVNRLLIDYGRQDMFVTVFYGVIDLDTLGLNYARAGHDLPWIVRGSEITELGGLGMALGLFREAEGQLTEEFVQLQPGDLLLLYTDGLPDLRNRDGNMLEGDGLRELVHSHAGQSPATFCENLFADMAAFQGPAPQFDDMALLAVEIR